MQHDHLSYFNLMELIKEKTMILKSWTFETTSTSGPALSEYLESTAADSFGEFRIVKDDRRKLSNDCLEHIARLLQELDRRFPPSPVQEHLSVLFDPQYLIKHKQEVSSNAYGRLSLDFLRKKYRDLQSFDSTAVRNEWESLKASLIDYIDCISPDYSPVTFWKNFINLKQSTNTSYRDQH
jgi:hypothetical protein